MTFVARKGKKRKKMGGEVPPEGEVKKKRGREEGEMAAGLCRIASRSVGGRGKGKNAKKAVDLGTSDVLSH